MFFYKSELTAPYYLFTCGLFYDAVLVSNVEMISEKLIS
jgi:hypothetical protein